MKKNILIIVFSNLKHDARVKRQADTLSSLSNVTVACHDAEPDNGFEIIKFAPTQLTLFRKAVASIFLLLRFYRIAYRWLHDYNEVIRMLNQQQYDLVVANDVETLPIAFKIAGTSPVLFDAHEYAPRHFEDKLMWRIFFQRFNSWLCKTYIPRVSGMTTVGKGLAHEYEKHFLVRPKIVHNAPKYFDIRPSGVNGENIRLIHHGIANRSRRLDLMVDLMERLDHRFTLDLMLIVPPSSSQATIAYLSQLQERASANKRIRFVPAVKSADIVKTINSYDIGVFLLPPVNFNYANTLPNKFFDFVQARLGIAIGPTPEMAEIVQQYQNGVVADNFSPESLAEKLNALNAEDIAQFKHRSNEVAKVFNSENSAMVLKDLVRHILDNRPMA